MVMRIKRLNGKRGGEESETDREREGKRVRVRVSDKRRTER